jgi:hypothetical protein
VEQPGPRHLRVLSGGRSRLRALDPAFVAGFVVTVFIGLLLLGILIAFLVWLLATLLRATF